MNQTELKTLMAQLLSHSKENEFLEFKNSNHAPDEIGKRISALANGAALVEQQYGYLVYGIEDGSHKVVGTTFKPSHQLNGNEEVELWLSKLLNPRIHFRIYEFEYEGKAIVLFRIHAAYSQPVTFKSVAYIRVGSNTRTLRDFPEKERKLWQRPSTEFEQEIALTDQTAADVIALLDTQAVFDLLLKIPYPTTQEGVIQKLLAEKFILKSNGHYHITHLGALLFAKNINDFDSISRKTARVVKYSGQNKLRTEKDQIDHKGYVNGFQGLMDFISGLLPSNEVIGTALRENLQMYPPLAVRELVANALIHQDFQENGTNILIEIYSDRIEISNPGQPLIDPNRFIDEYKSRNATLAAIMRRADICEEKGSGIDKVILECEFWQLPAPDFQIKQTHTKAILYATKGLRGMSKSDKVRACYQHCALQYVTNQRMTNQSLRKRLNVEDHNYSSISRIIKDALDEKVIRPEDPDNKSKKFMSYVPYWA
jgi:predicted HTH transcriptional regulator